MTGNSLDQHMQRYAQRTAGMRASAIRALFAVANRPEVVSLAGGMPYLKSLPLDSLAAEAAALVAEGGFTALKMRLGRDRLADDLAAIAAVREGAGADVRLMCDFNQGLSLGDALVRCHALDDQGLDWFEEPTTYDNIPGHAQLARELKTPVSLGENFYGPRQLFHAIRAGAGDYVMPT